MGSMKWPTETVRSLVITYTFDRQGGSPGFDNHFSSKMTSTQIDRPLSTSMGSNDENAGVIDA